LIIFFDIVVCHDKINVAIYLVCGGLYFMLNKKVTLLTLFSTVTVMSLFSIGRTPLGPLNVQGEENQLSLSTVSLNIHQSFGQPAQNVTNFYELLIAVEDDSTRSFAYDVSTSRVGSRGTNWFKLFTTNDDDSIFETYVDAEYPLPGSDLNKWILTNVTMKVALYAPTSDPVSINLVTKGKTPNITYPIGESFEPITNSISVTTFNTSNVTLSQNFGFGLGINEFSIVPSQDIYFTEFTLTYSIDYSSCPIEA
jgi:hypothetical protein